MATLGTQGNPKDERLVTQGVDSFVGTVKAVWPKDVGEGIAHVTMLQGTQYYELDVIYAKQRPEVGQTRTITPDPDGAIAPMYMQDV